MALYPIQLIVDIKEPDIISPVIIIEDREEALGMITDNLKLRAKVYKRDWVSLLYNPDKVEELVRWFKKINQKGKTWIHLANFCNSPRHIDSLKKIMY